MKPETKSSHRAATAQIVVYLDPETNEIRAEMPTANGSRRKLDVPDSMPPSWVAALFEMNTWLRDQEARQKEQDQRRQYSQVEVAALKASGLTNSEIINMQRRGENPGTSFFGDHATEQRKNNVEAARALHRRVWDTTAARKGQGPDFANRVLGSRAGHKAIGNIL